jgi:hypothetical protein
VILGRQILELGGERSAKTNFSLSRIGYQSARWMFHVLKIVLIPYHPRLKSEMPVKEVQLHQRKGSVDFAEKRDIPKKLAQD